MISRPFSQMIYLKQKKNMGPQNLSRGNQMQYGVIPLAKQVTTMKYNKKQDSLLCGCADGQIVLINLKQKLQQLLIKNDISQTYLYYKHHKKVVRDVLWLSYNLKEQYSFASVADDGMFLIWDKQAANPVLSIAGGSLTPFSLIQICPNQLVLAARDCMLKFFDLSKHCSYTYNENTEIITNLLNLTDQIEIQKTKRQSNFDSSLRFASCQKKGKIVFWQGQKEFQHLTHNNRIASLDYLNSKGGLFLVIQKQNGKLSIFSPILGSYSFQNQSQ